MSVYTPTQLVCTTPSTTQTTLYTSTGKTIVKNIILANTSASSANVTLKVNGKTIVPATPISANSVVTIDASIVLEAGQTLTGLQGTASAVDMIVSGVVIS